MPGRKLAVHRKVEVYQRLTRLIETFVGASRLDIDNCLYCGHFHAEFFRHFPEILLGQSPEAPKRQPFVGEQTDGISPRL